jgi:flagellar biosynthesis protein FlhF
MNLQTFKATTMAQALSQVKHTLGADAVILHTRTYQRRHWMGLRCREVVEITAGKGNRSAKGDHPAPRRPRPAPQIPAAYRAVASSSAAAQHSPKPSPPGQQLLQTPAAGHAIMLNLTQEMGQLRSMVKDLVVQTRQKQVPNIPEHLFEYYTQLISSQVAEELAGQIIQTLHIELRPEHFAQPEFVRRKLADQLEKLLPTAGPIVRTKTIGPHVVALVGPTGVGKTTTIAKLAANLKLREKHRVGLITLDTYRIAAVDQLRKYADIIGSPLKVVGSPEDLREAVASMGDCDFILIDTAGRSPNDTLKINELRNFLAAVEPDEVHLVLSTTASQACVELAIERFSAVRVDKIIFTKLDEAAHVGVVLNVARKVNKALSYVTTGQDVPDDIEVGRGNKLAQLILGSDSGGRHEM